jgi:integrase
MPKSTQSAEGRKASGTKPDWHRPYPDFPLSYHPPSGRLYKKIRGRRFYFGYANDWQTALAKYTRERDDLYAGRTPRPSGDGLTVRDLCNRFLTSKQGLLETGEITHRTFADYHRTCKIVLGQFGRNHLVDDLSPDMFDQLRSELAKTRQMVALGNEVQRIRVMFKYAFDAGLIDKPVRLGPTFKKPSRRALRRERRANGKKMFEADEIRALADAASPQIRAMILLGVNCGFGNADCANLPIPSVDLQGGWIDFPRPKTGVERRCPLWPETVAALRAALVARATPKDESDGHLLFITKYGQSWHKETSANPISAEFRKLAQEISVYRKGVGFYALRHTFETIGGESRDQVAVDHIMGHTRDDMASRYRERISDERLKAVADTIHNWLFAEDAEKAGE